MEKIFSNRGKSCRSKLSEPPGRFVSGNSSTHGETTLVRNKTWNQTRRDSRTEY